jgi:hypothetical protein
MFRTLADFCEISINQADLIVNPNHEPAAMPGIE